MNAPAAQDLYAVLGVARDAPAREIRRAYRRLARQHHPDLNEQRGGPEQFVRLADAYEILRDPAQRARYDRTLPQPAVTSQPARFPDHPGSPIGVVGVRRGILELSPAEASRVARYPLALHDADGHTILLPAGTRHGDQITVSHGAHAVVLTVQTARKT
jgi:curved DNA-binding protein CbpA